MMRFTRYLMLGTCLLLSCSKAGQVQTPTNQAVQSPQANPDQKLPVVETQLSDFAGMWHAQGIILTFYADGQGGCHFQGGGTVNAGPATLVKENGEFILDALRSIKPDDRCKWKASLSRDKKQLEIVEVGGTQKRILTRKEK